MNHLALWGFAEFAFCLTRMNPEMVYLHQDSGFLNVSYYKFDSDDVTGMLTLTSSSMGGGMAWLSGRASISINVVTLRQFGHYLDG